MKKNKYWLERQAIQRNLFADKSHKQLCRKLAAHYKSTLKDVEAMMTDLYLNILNADGIPQANEMYRYNRYFQLREELVKRLNELGVATLKELDEKMEGVYKYTTSQVTNDLAFGGIDEYKLHAVVQELWDAKGRHWSTNVWCKDGLNASDRISKNMGKLQNTLEKGLMDCVARGASKDELVKELKYRFDVSFSEADRLARTEMTYLQNQATVESYKKAGITQYQYLATDDSRTSKICHSIDGERYEINEAVVGVNYPPMHANCRCTTIPVLN